MALQNHIDWSTIESAIYNWMFAATGITVNWVTQDRPEPPYPYITLKRSDSGFGLGAPRGEKIENTELGNPAGEEIEQTVVRDVEFFLSCQCRTSDDAPGSDSNSYLESAKYQLTLPSVREALRGAGAILVESEPVLDLDEVLGEEWTSGASMDVRFRTLATVTEKTGYIAKVGVEGTFTNVAGATVVNYTEDIPE
jgi:hypothetical protein